MAYVAMATKVLQQFNLSQGSLGENLLAEDISDLLDCYAFACLVVCCRTAFTPVSPSSAFTSGIEEAAAGLHANKTSLVPFMQ